MSPTLAKSTTHAATSVIPTMSWAFLFSTEDCHTVCKWKVKASLREGGKPCDPCQHSSIILSSTDHESCQGTTTCSPINPENIVIGPPYLRTPFNLRTPFKGNFLKNEVVERALQVRKIHPRGWQVRRQGYSMPEGWKLFGPSTYVRQEDPTNWTESRTKAREVLVLQREGDQSVEGTTWKFVLAGQGDQTGLGRKGSIASAIDA